MMWVLLAALVALGAFAAFATYQWVAWRSWYLLATEDEETVVELVPMRGRERCH